MREAAVQILVKIEKDSAYSNALLSKHVERGKYTQKEKGILYQLVKGTLEMRSRVDLVLNELLSKGVSSLPIIIRNNLRLAVYQILFSEKSAPPGIVSQAVDFSKKHGHKGTTGLTNAVLRKVVSRREEFLTPPSELHEPNEIADWYSHPLWLIEKLLKQIGEEETIQFCESNNQAWDIHLRVNSLRAQRDELLDKLRKEGVVCEPSEYHPLVVKIQELSGPLDSLESFNDGLFQVQDESSVYVASLMQAVKGEMLLDLCAAPGGKATYLAEQLSGEGSVCATDIHHHKLRRVDESSRRLGHQNILPFCSDGLQLSTRKLFDGVLLDAPCTGSGVLGRKGDLRWNRGEEDISELLVLQKELLDTAASVVKPGGRLLYGTCSVLVEENEDQVAAFLARHDDFEISELPQAICPKTFLTDESFFRSWPHRHDIGGAFGALMKRKS